MKIINKEMDLGYIISSHGTIVPIKPLLVNHKLIKRSKYKPESNILFIHNEIVKYYIAVNSIKNAEDLLDREQFQLYCGLTKLNLVIMIRSLNKFYMFIPDHITKKQYDSINGIVDELKEDIKEIGDPYLVDGSYSVEFFNDLKIAVKTLNRRYKENL